LHLAASSSFHRDWTILKLYEMPSQLHVFYTN